MFQKGIYIRLIQLIMILGFSCSEEETTLFNEDLIFSNSVRLKIPAYEYRDSLDIVYHVSGDIASNTANPDVLNSLPVLEWDSVGLRIVTCAIFSAPIEVWQGEITNTNNIVWQWHNGMNFGREGNVQFNEGKNVINGEIQYAGEVSPLTTGLYYWGVWGWNSAGTRIICSSRQVIFYVDD